jgi:hypothetical protein
MQYSEVGSLNSLQEHIYGEKVVNPLEDDSAAFSAQFSGRCHAQLEHESAHVKHTNAFPKDKHTGTGSIRNFLPGVGFSYVAKWPEMGRQRKSV